MDHPNIKWPHGLVRERPQAEEVHVWAVPLNPADDALIGFEKWLSPEERSRAAAFKLPGLGKRYTVAHAQLRRLLSEYLNCDPAGLEFEQTSRGKPRLRGEGAEPLHFNLAHSDELALVAVATSAAVGVDVERIRPMADALNIAERFFSARELAALRGVPPASRDAAFFRLWTRKEAWLKATGEGISESLSKIEVAFLPDESPRVLAIAGDETVAEAWRLCALEPAGGFVGALAICCRAVRLRCWCAGI